MQSPPLCCLHARCLSTHTPAEFKHSRGSHAPSLMMNLQCHSAPASLRALCLPPSNEHLFGERSGPLGLRRHHSVWRIGSDCDILPNILLSLHLLCLPPSPPWIQCSFCFEVSPEPALSPLHAVCVASFNVSAKALGNYAYFMKTDWKEIQLLFKLTCLTFNLLRCFSCQSQNTFLKVSQLYCKKCPHQQNEVNSPVIYYLQS